MNPAKRVETIRAGIKAQELIKSECKKNGDAVGARRAQNKIDDYNRELNDIGRQV
ncbi:hypothetical protein SEA_FAUST_11 [Streptomyces phage Faust]|uniref:Uncharacterized protein n=1 Tax=Streptomyces phage Faust TaxID=2767565 RepID=A0A7G9UYL2_9CAUD|nr:hypothetical protein PP456_gp011 [Streptomyces phage Faust]QNN99117.1 hypothetical protein SEA_FAUST_11 [Streptomyces phage Faust]